MHAFGFVYSGVQVLSALTVTAKFDGAVLLEGTQGPQPVHSPTTFTPLGVLE